MHRKTLSVVELRNSVAGASGLLPVAEYMRMSTDQQRYSIEYQCGIIRKYAVQHGMAVVRTYLDDGKSGLKLAGRFGLKALLNDIQNNRADYAAVLVYDISRWGRFQDTDESAYYEYLCKLAGVRVIYCVEQFDDSPMGGLIKNIKRVMAGEYSRNLSVRVWGGQAQAVANGFRMGGEPGYGLRRFLLGINGEPKATLQRHEWKSLTTDRVILVPGPREEVENVWKIYDSYALHEKSTQQIANDLNAARVKGAQKWTRGRVAAVLSDPKYAGDNLYNRLSFKLRGKKIKNPEELWVRRDKAFRGLVSREYFDHVAELRCARKGRDKFQTDDLKRQLRALLQKKGHLSSQLIDAEPDMADYQTFVARFGCMRAACEAVGYCSLVRRPVREWISAMLERRSTIVDELVAGYRAAGVSAVWDNSIQVLRINGQRMLSVRIFRCHLRHGAMRWHVNRLHQSTGMDFLIVRLDPENKSIFDLHTVPASAMKALPKHIISPGTPSLRPYRIPSLAALFTSFPEAPGCKCVPGDTP